MQGGSICPYEGCGQVFATPAVLKRHAEAAHPAGKIREMTHESSLIPPSSRLKMEDASVEPTSPPGAAGMALEAPTFTPHDEEEGSPGVASAPRVERRLVGRDRDDYWEF